MGNYFLNSHMRACMMAICLLFEYKLLKNRYFAIVALRF